MRTPIALFFFWSVLLSVNTSEDKVLFDSEVITRPQLSHRVSTSGYETLKITPYESEIVGDLIDTVADHSSLSLLTKKAHLRKQVRNLRQVHILKILETALVDTHLRTQIYNIKKSRFKWRNFSSRIKKMLDKEASVGRLRPYLRDFSKRVDISPTPIETLAENGLWDQFLDYLLENRIAQKG